MNVLSLFDGIACGRLALERAGIKVDNYFASEIDKYAMQIALKNYPDIIQLGDINKWEEWDLPKIDLIMGGSPCTNLSVAGDGKGLEGSQSSLFYKFVDIVKAYKPKYFLLENVRMKKEWADLISKELGVEPTLINSALVSAQNRERLYWANFPISQPEDKGILLKDIIHENTDQYIKIDRKGKYKKYQNKASTLTVGCYGAGNHSDMDLIGVSCIELGHAIDIQGHDFLKRIYSVCSVFHLTISLRKTSSK